MAAKKRQTSARKPAVILPAITPPRGSPFAGISKTGAPARETQIPHLTAQVQIAKARQERLNQGGLLTPEQRAQEQRAAKTLAKPETRASQTRAKPSARTALSQSTPPLVLGAPPAALSAALPNSTPARTPRPPARRGAPPTPRQQLQAKQPGQGSITGAIGSGITAVGHGIDAAARRSAYHQAKLSQSIAGVGVQGAVPKNFTIPIGDLVGTAAAATGKKAITKDELARLEAQGVDLKPSLFKQFTEMGLKNGWSEAELEGLSGSARIDKAFTKPAALPLRIAANFAGDIAQFGTIPAAGEGIVRETIAGHGGEVAKALGEGLYSQLPVVGKHPVGDMATAHPFQFFSQFAGAGKTAGGASGALRGLKGAEAAERVVKSAASGLEVTKPPLARNAYTATGELIAGKAQSTIPRIGQRLEAEVVDKAVRRAAYKHAPEYIKVQRPYTKALDKVGHKRAAELLGRQMAGGKPEQLAAFYRAQGNADNAAFFDNVAKNTRTLTEKDHAFLDAHRALASKTTQAHMDIGKFGPTAAQFRAYSPLIRSAAHLGNPEAQRVLALRDEYLKGFNTMPEQDLAALRGAIDQGVEDFAKTHKAQGGIDPTYVEYSQPRPLIAPPYKPGPGGATGFKKPRGRQKAETGASFESGQYLIDPKAPIVESVRVQRAHLADVLHEDVANAVGKPLGPGEIVPRGYVAVSKTNLRGLKQTLNDLTDNPVSQPAYDEFAAQKQGIFDRLTGAAMPEGQQVKRGDSVIAIPIGSWKRILDHTRPGGRSAYDRFLKQYQRVLVSYRPSTAFNNAGGGLILAATGGASPIGTGTHLLGGAYRDAWRAMRDPTLGPSVARGHGVAGSFAGDARSTVGAGFDWMRSKSAVAEDFFRLATFFSKAGPSISKRAKALNMSADDYQRAFVTGQVDEPLLNKFLDHMEDFTGEMLKPDGKLGRFAGKTVLFHKWIGHMAKLILFTLPVKHPRRLAILNELSDYGDQYRQEHGVWPDWYAAYLPLFQEAKRIGKAGVPQVFTKAYSTQGVNSFATLQQYADPVSTTEGLKSILLGVAAPPIQIAGRTIFDRPYDSKSAARYALGQTVRQIPGVSVVRPQGGMGPDSIPFVSEQRKVYSSGKKRHGKTVPLPWDFRPGARPEPGILGGLERYLFGGVYDVPAQGPVHAIEQKKHIGAVAKKARKG